MVEPSLSFTSTVPNICGWYVPSLSGPRANAFVTSPFSVSKYTYPSLAASTSSNTAEARNSLPSLVMSSATGGRLTLSRGSTRNGRFVHCSQKVS